MKTSALAIALSASAVSAHSTFQQIWVAGEDLAGTCVRAPVRFPLPRTPVGLLL